MENLTFEKLPQAVAGLYDRLDCIEKIITAIPKQTRQDDLMNISQAAQFLDLANATVYGLVSRREIPFSKRGKRLYFSRNELEKWVKEGRKKTVEEIAGETRIKVKGGLK